MNGEHILSYDEYEEYFTVIDEEITFYLNNNQDKKEIKKEDVIRALSALFMGHDTTKLYSLLNKSFVNQNASQDITCDYSSFIDFFTNLFNEMKEDQVKAISVAEIKILSYFMRPMITNVKHDGKIIENGIVNCPVNEADFSFFVAFIGPDNYKHVGAFGVDFSKDGKITKMIRYPQELNYVSAIVPYGK